MKSGLHCHLDEHRAKPRLEPEITAEQREKLMHVQSLVGQAERITGSLTPEKIVMPSDRAERAGIEAMWLVHNRLTDITDYIADLTGTGARDGSPTTEDLPAEPFRRP